MGAAVGAGVEPSAGLVVEWMARRVTESGPMPSSWLPPPIEADVLTVGVEEPGGDSERVCGPRSPM